MDPSISKGSPNSEPSMNRSVHCREINPPRGKICAKKFDKRGKCESEKSYSSSDDKQQDQSESVRRCESENSYSNSDDTSSKTIVRVRVNLL